MLREVSVRFCCSVSLAARQSAGGGRGNGRGGGGAQGNRCCRPWNASSLQKKFQPLVMNRGHSSASPRSKLSMYRLSRSSWIRHDSYKRIEVDGSRIEGKEGRAVTIKGIQANLILGIGKALAGIIGNSSAMIADAIHTFSDLATDFVTLWTHGMARKPWSVEHPYGFGKFETIGATVVSVVLIISGIGIATHSVEHIFTMGEHLPGQIALVAAFISIVVKEFLYRITMNVAKKERSDVLVANAWHHRSDAVSSVVAFLGIGGALMGLPFLDPVAGVIVAGLIIRAGYQIFLDSVKELTDNQAIEQETIESISNLLRGIPDILGYHNLRSRKMGPYSLVDLHITVDPKLTVTAGHQIAERARRAILDTFPQVREALIHVEGHGQNDHKLLPSHATVVFEMKQILQKFPDIRDSDFFAIHYLGEQVHASFAIVLDKSLSVREAQQIGIAARDALLYELPYLTEVVVKLELTKRAKHEPPPPQINNMNT